MQIDRCYCFQVRFAELRRVANATGAATVADLQAHRTFGQKCQLCHPYVRRMLRTGETCFHEVINATDEPPASSTRAPASEQTDRSGP